MAYVFAPIDFSSLTYEERRVFMDKLRRVGYRALLHNDMRTELEIQAIMSDLSYSA